MSDRDAGLGGCLRGRVVLVTGAGTLAAALAERLSGCGCVVRPFASPTAAVEHLAAAPPDAAIVSLQSLPGAPAEVGMRVFETLALLQSAPGLRHVVVMVPADGGRSIGSVAARLVRTLTIYATVHTAEADVRINALLVPGRPGASAIARVGDVSLALLSGLLDGVRGQTLAIDAPQEAHA